MICVCYNCSYCIKNVLKSYLQSLYRWTCLWFLPFAPLIFKLLQEYMVNVKTLIYVDSVSTFENSYCNVLLLLQNLGFAQTVYVGCTEFHEFRALMLSTLFFLPQHSPEVWLFSCTTLCSVFSMINVGFCAFWHCYTLFLWKLPLSSRSIVIL